MFLRVRISYSLVENMNSVYVDDTNKVLIEWGVLGCVISSKEIQWMGNKVYDIFRIGKASRIDRSNC